MSINVISVALGGIVGALSRALLQSFFSTTVIAHIPFAVIIINSIGCFLMGIFLHSGLTPPSLREFVVVGFLGSFTTFSAFSADFWLLLETGAYLTATWHMSLSIIIPLIAFFFGTRATALFY